MRKDLYAAVPVALGQEIKIERNDDVITQMIATQ